MPPADEMPAVGHGDKVKREAGELVEDIKEDRRERYRDREGGDRERDRDSRDRYRDRDDKYDKYDRER